MKSLLLVLSLLIGSALAHAQAQSIPIPAHAKVLRNGAVDGTDGGTFWICSGGSTRVKGNQNIIYVDEQGGLWLEGNQNTVYSVSTGDIQVRGDANVIYTTSASGLTVNGDANSLHIGNGLIAKMAGNGNRKVELKLLSFSYADAPLDSCDAVSSLPLGTTNGIEILPNPVPFGREFTLKTDTPPVGTITLTDREGRLVRNYPANASPFSVRDLPIGEYSLRLTYGSEPVEMPLYIR